MKFLGKAVKYLFRLGFFLLGGGVIVAAGYILGLDLIWGKTGNDLPNSFTFVVWLDKFFPKIPYWFPLQGGGVSFMQGYNSLSLLAVVFLKRLLGLSLAGVYDTWLFLGPILTATTIYFWAWWRLKSQVIGLLAGVFYLLAPVSWVFLTEWGFYNEASSYFLVPLALAFFDYYLETKKPGALLGTGVLFSLALMTHLHAWMFLTVAITFYGVGYSFLVGKGRRLAGLTAGMGAVTLTAAVVVLLSLFWLVPFADYNRMSGRGMSIGLFNRKEIADMVPPWKSVLQLTRIGEEDYQYPLRNVAVPVVVWGLALAGWLVSFFKSKKIFVLGSLLVLESFYYLSVESLYWVSEHITPLYNLITLRSYLFSVRLITPLVAAYGLVELAGLPFLPLKRWLGGVRHLLAGGLALALAAWLVVSLAKVPRWGERQINYGPDTAGENIQLLVEGREGLDWSRFWDQRYLYQALGKWQKPSGGEETADWLAGRLPRQDNLRIDLSSKLGAAVERINIDNHHLSQMSLYTFNLFLNRPLWGYQQAVFYSGEGKYRSAKPLNEIANWYGINYVALDPREDPVYKYEQSNWIMTEGKEGVQIWQNPTAPRLAELTSQPKVLVIGGKQQFAAYEQIYRLANYGGLSWREAYLVAGNGNVDDYQLAELERFEALILYGYSYRDRQKAWQLLEDYVRGGGRLWLDTGWQYTSADWEMAQAPTGLPFESLGWHNLGQTGAYVLADEWQSKVSAADFAALEWEGKGWGFSSFESGKLRDWGETVLSVADYPLVVSGRLGQGRLVWSGMNLPAHAITYENEAEVELFHQLMLWLLDGYGRREYPVAVTRTHPDTVLFKTEQAVAEGTALLWRESRIPYWQAESGGKRLAVYPAGPELTLVLLPALPAGATISLQIQMPLQYLALKLMSLLVLLFLVALAVRPQWRAALSGSFTNWQKRFLVRTRKNWEKEDY